MPKREFLMLAHKYEPGKYGIANWLMSDKLDGVRAFWDGGLTRGMSAIVVPWANVEKDSRLLTERYATGLWTRYGHPIHAPRWWLDRLPPIPLDGELWAGVSSFQRVVSITKCLIPGPEWRSIKYMVFDSPSLDTVFADGEIKVTNYKKVLRDCASQFGSRWSSNKDLRSFERTLSLLETLDQNETFQVHRQEVLPFSTSQAIARVSDRLDEVTSAGGEGLMLRAPHSLWTPARAHTLLKVKGLHDMEGTVVGCTHGRRTELGSKLLGKMGALILKLDSGVRLELSGFTDEERALTTADGDVVKAREFAEAHPGEDAPLWILPSKFPIDSRVTFRYRELSDDGVPKEARYLRR